MLEIGNSEAGFDAFSGSEGYKLLTAIVGGQFYSAHPGAFDSQGVETFLNLYDTVPDIVYTLIVVGLLALFGYRMVDNAKVEFDEVGAAVQGATVALGYGLSMAISVLALGAVLGEGSELFSDQLTDITLVAGIVYPAVCSGGGALAAILQSDTSGSRQAGAPQGPGTQRQSGGQQPRRQRQSAGNQPTHQQGRGQTGGNRQHRPEGQHAGEARSEREQDPAGGGHSGDAGGGGE